MKTQAMDFARPDNLDQALSLLATGNWRVLAGGTDFYPGLRDRPSAFPVLDISAIKGLRDIQEGDDHFHIGALATWSDVIATRLPPAFDGLKLAAREVGSVQIQNRATVTGNICNASPAADGVPPLLTLDACVLIGSADGRREVSLDEFIQGNRKTGLLPGELVTAIRIPKKSATGNATFLKLGARKYLVISIVMVAARIERDEAGLIRDAAISVGACSAVAKRLTLLEKALIGIRAESDAVQVVAREHLAALAPIDDIRASAAYRMDAALELMRRAISLAANGAHP